MIPITVRLANSDVDVHITQRLSGLSWRTVAPGGFASASFTLQQAIDFTSPMLEPFTRAYIYDGRSGDTLWEGRLSMPGRSAGEQGQVWALTAIGPSAHALDQTAPLIYIDRLLDGWEPAMHEGGLMTPAMQVGAGNHPDVNSTDVILCTIPPGVPVVDNSRAAAIYQKFIGSGMELGIIAFTWDAGFTSTWAVEAATGTAASPYLEIPFTAPVNLTGGTFFGAVVDHFPAGRDLVTVRLRRTSGGPATTVTDATWASFESLRVLGRRMTKTGTLVVGSAGMNSTSVNVKASWVVADLLGRMLPQYDGTNAIIDTSDTIAIDQLAYHDGATANQVLDDLMKLEPNTYWAAWESGPNGKYRFEWKKWGTQPRYEASVEDGFDSPAPSFEVYNRVKVRYKDPRGRTRIFSRSQAVASLDALGIVREWFEDLSDEAGSAANAAAFATNFLADHASPSSGGTLTINRPIRDLVNLRWVDPWQIVPGEIITVRGIEASQEVTGTPTRDGLTTFKIVAVEARDDGTATLELDMFTPSESRALVNVAKRRIRKR